MVKKKKKKGGKLLAKILYLSKIKFRIFLAAIKNDEYDK